MDFPNERETIRLRPHGVDTPGGDEDAKKGRRRRREEGTPRRVARRAQCGRHGRPEFIREQQRGRRRDVDESEGGAR